MINFPRCLSRCVGYRCAHRDSSREESRKSRKIGPSFGKECACHRPTGALLRSSGWDGDGGLTPENHTKQHACPQVLIRRPGGAQRVGRAGSPLSLPRAVPSAASSRWFPPPLVSAAPWSQLPLDSAQVAAALLGAALAVTPVSGRGPPPPLRTDSSITCSHVKVPY